MQRAVKRDNIHNLEDIGEYTSLHPVQQSLLNFQQVEKQRKELTIRNIYGSDMLTKLALDEALVSQPLRLPGFIPSSNLGNEVITGKDISFSFEDWFDHHVEQDGVHEEMEKKIFGKPL